MVTMVTIVIVTMATKVTIVTMATKVTIVTMAWLYSFTLDTAALDMVVKGNSV